MSLELDTSDSESRTEAVGKSRGQFALEPVHASSHTAVPSVNWNRGPNTAIRTSLRDRSVFSHSSQHSLDLPLSKQAEDNLHLDQTDAAQPLNVEENSEVISISDDSSIGPAQDSNAIVLNVDNHQVAGTQTNNELIEISDEEDTVESFVIDAERAPVGGHIGKNIGYSTDGSTPTTRSAGDRYILGATFGNTKVNKDGPSDQYSTNKKAEGPQKLSELDAKDLEDQFKYALFYFDREQIDLNRAVTCLFCLEEGHMQDLCSLKECEHCSAWDEHFSQNCPKWRRCLRCRERGHDISQCTSRLKDASVPCDLCGNSSHLEDKCCLQWNIPSVRKLDAPIEMYICCAICGQSSHLLGDCPQRKRNGHFAAWTLKDLDSTKIVNLSLQKGTRKIAKTEEWRAKPELRIKGRAGRPPPLDHEDQDEEHIEFFGPRVARNERNHIRFGEDRLDTKRLKLDDHSRGGRDAYQPRHTIDRYDPSNARGPEPRDRYYNPFQDERRRSRSPPRDDRWRPPGGRDDRWRPSFSLPPKAATKPNAKSVHNDNFAGGNRGGYRPGRGKPGKRRK